MPSATGASAMRRLKAAAWWAAISIVCVAVASFIVFDVLDLDGSNFSPRSTQTSLTADAPTVEAERLMSLAGDFGSAPSRKRPSTLPPPALSSAVRRSPPPPVFRAHRRIAHLHAGKDDAQTAVAASPTDPA